jgi:hypothetical protein
MFAWNGCAHLACVGIFAKQCCGPTKTFWPCHHAIIYTTTYFPKQISWHPSFSKLSFFFPKQEPRFILETKVLLKLSSYKLKGT